VAGGHEVAGLPVGSVTDLVAIVSPCSKPILACRVQLLFEAYVPDWSGVVRVFRTLGIAAWPLNRLRTRLSIPLGLRHEGSTPIHCQHRCSFLQYRVFLTFEAVALVAVEALGVCMRFRQLRIFDVTFRGVAYAS
jgi:hypothetical protein